MSNYHTVFVHPKLIIKKGKEKEVEVLMLAVRCFVSDREAPHLLDSLTIYTCSINRYWALVPSLTLQHVCGPACLPSLLERRV